MKNNRIIQDGIDENCNADDATNKNHNRSSNAPNRNAFLFTTTI